MKISLQKYSIRITEKPIKPLPSRRLQRGQKKPTNQQHLFNAPIDWDYWGQYSLQCRVEVNFIRVFISIFIIPGYPLHCMTGCETFNAVARKRRDSFDSSGAIVARVTIATSDFWIYKSWCTRNTICTIRSSRSSERLIIQHARVANMERPTACGLLVSWNIQMFSSTIYSWMANSNWRHHRTLREACPTNWNALCGQSDKSSASRGLCRSSLWWPHSVRGQCITGVSKSVVQVKSPATDHGRATLMMCTQSLPWAAAFRREQSKYLAECRRQSFYNVHGWGLTTIWNSCTPRSQLLERRNLFRKFTCL